MEKIRVYYDEIGNTLNVWFDDPQKEVVSEEVGGEVILNKDKDDKVIGFEKLNFISKPDEMKIKKVPVEILV
ncbi:MAG: DUF2283 domain-containing protein [Elusimicrobiota bacterium]